MTEQDAGNDRVKRILDLYHELDQENRQHVRRMVDAQVRKQELAEFLAHIAAEDAADIQAQVSGLTNVLGALPPGQQAGWLRILLEGLERRQPDTAAYERMLHELRLDIMGREASGRWRVQ